MNPTPYSTTAHPEIIIPAYFEFDGEVRPLGRNLQRFLAYFEWNIRHMIDPNFDELHEVDLSEYTDVHDLTVRACADQGPDMPIDNVFEILTEYESEWLSFCKLGGPFSNAFDAGNIPLGLLMYAYIEPLATRLLSERGITLPIPPPPPPPEVQESTRVVITITIATERA